MGRFVSGGLRWPWSVSSAAVRPWLRTSLSGITACRSVAPTTWRIDALSFNYQTVGDSVVSQTGDLVVVYKQFYESLPFAYSVDLRGSTSFRKDPILNKLVGDAEANLLSRIKKYRRDEGSFFMFGDTDLDLSEDFDRPALKFTIGFGFGRFINATALRKAVRIEDFLLEEGIISERMQKETMIDLGHIVEKENEYRDLYGNRYQNYWYEDMQNEVQKSGKVLGSIGAIGVLRMQEVLERERINERFYGWDISAGVQLEAFTPFKSEPRDDPAFSLGVRYSRPISWSAQFQHRHRHQHALYRQLRSTLRSGRANRLHLRNL